MRVLMLGWEFPPFISGGLGVACYGLTRAMSELGVEVFFVLPRAVRSDLSTHVRLIAPKAMSNGNAAPAPAPEPASASWEPVMGPGGLLSYRLKNMEHVTFVPVQVNLTPYATAGTYAQRAETERTALLEEIESEGVSELREINREQLGAVAGGSGPESAMLTGQYGRNLMSEVHRYTKLLMAFAHKIEFDVIHAHDWMTFPAALAVAGITGKPLVVHVHSTEFDRSGDNVNQIVYDIERAGMHGATKVIAVSNLTRNICISRYGADPEKVEVVHNQIDIDETAAAAVQEGPVDFNKNERLVLFLGRMTMQKGPEYFVAAAKKVLEKMGNVKFVMAGDGDMFRRVIELAAHLGIGHRILFTGFLRGDDVQKIFRMADLFVMPSVSEPFGLVPLEAMSQNVPVIISKQSGVSEVLTHVLKVDFWDINEMANKIIAVLRHAPLQETLKKHAHFEVRKFSWHDAASACVKVYERAVAHS